MRTLILPSSAPMRLHAAVILSLANSVESPSFKVYFDSNIRVHLRDSLYLAWQSLEERQILEDDSAPFERFCRESPAGEIAIVDVEQSGRIRPLMVSKDPEELIALGEWVNGWKIDSGITRNNLTLRSYCGLQQGETGIIIGTGPSLLRTDLRQLSRFPTIGCNKLFLLDKYYFFRPNFLLIEDRLILEDHADELAKYTGTEKLYPYDHFERHPASAFFPLWRSYPMYPQFSTDFSDAAYSGWSVTFLLLQFACYLGWRKIILLGIDGNSKTPEAQYLGDVGRSESLDVDHFDATYYGPGRRFHRPKPELVEAAFHLARSVLFDRGVEVWNCSPNTKVTAFPLQSLEAALEC
jgi:hypothetical protein